VKDIPYVYIKMEIIIATANIRIAPFVPKYL
jgi:hypothetical protein